MRAADKTSPTWMEMFGFASAIDPEISGSRRRVALAAAGCVVLIFMLMCVNIAAFAMGSQAASIESVMKRLDTERMELERTLAQNTNRAWIGVRAGNLGMAPFETGQRIQDNDEAH
ncbi:MAG: hypothetical protein ACI91F_002027 [Candidatus Binatia bacterium]|jgi:hypothetical protein